MDRTDGVPGAVERGAIEVADDAFQQSMVRLSQHLATRRTPPPPPPLPQRRHRSTGWPLALLIATATAGAAGYQYAAFTDGDLLRAARPRVAEAATTIAAPGPVFAAVAIAPDPAAHTPAALSPGNAGSPTGASVGPAALPPPAEFALPAPLPAPPIDLGMPQPEIALSWDEVLEVQKRLASLGIDPGPLDGIVGPRTIAAVQRYQELRGRAVTGKIYRSLLSQLQQDQPSSTLEAKGSELSSMAVGPR